MRLHKSTFLLLSLILANMSWSQDQPGRLLRSMVDFPRHFDVEPIQTSPEQPTSSQLPTREEVANSYIIEIPNVVPQSSEHTNGRFRESSYDQFGPESHGQLLFQQSEESGISDTDFTIPKTQQRRSRLLDKFNDRLKGVRMPSTLSARSPMFTEKLDTRGPQLDFDSGEPILEFTETERAYKSDVPNVPIPQITAVQPIVEEPVEMEVPLPKTSITPPVLPVAKKVIAPEAQETIAPEVRATTATQTTLRATENAEPPTATNENVLSKTVTQQMPLTESIDQTANVKIHPPMVQPYNKNQYTFVVENVGDSAARDVIVGITVPETSTISAVLPQSALVTQQHTMVKFPQMAPGERQLIHVNANSLTSQPVSFDATLTMKTVQKFSPSGFVTQEPEQSTLQETPKPATAPNSMLSQQDLPLRQGPLTTSVQKFPAFGSAHNMVGTQPPVPQTATTNNPMQTLASPSAAEIAQLAELEKLGRVQNPYFDRLQKAAQAATQRQSAIAGHYGDWARQASPNLADSGSFAAQNIYRLPETAPHLGEPVSVNSTPVQTSQPDMIAPPAPTNAPTAEQPKQKYVVAAIITGPKVLKHQQVADYEIAVYNQTGRPATDVQMHLAVPAGLEVVAAEPRAYYDNDLRQVSWDLASVADSENKVIRYRVRATGKMLQNQKATLQIGEQTIGDTYFATKILASDDQSMVQRKAVAARTAGQLPKNLP